MVDTNYFYKMNSDNLLNTIEKYLPFDIIFIISDKTNTITMRAHKIILLSQCIYFEKLFINFAMYDLDNILVSVNYGTENVRKIKINVHNAYICYDIFQSFYNRVTNVGEYPYWYHLLESFRCRDFFGLKIDQSLLLNLNVPEEGFEILMDVIDLLGYTDENIKIINKVLPKKYNLSKFPRELINNMIENAIRSIIIVGIGRDDIRAWNIQKNKLTRTYYCTSKDQIVYLCASPNGKYIITGYFNGTIKIRDGRTYMILRLCVPLFLNNTYPNGTYPNGTYLNGTYPNGRIVNMFCLETYQKDKSDPDNNKIICCHENGTINMWNIDTGELINSLADIDLFHDKIWYFVPSSDHNVVVYGTRNGKIKILDVRTFILIHTINDIKTVYERDSYKCCMCFSPDDKKMIFGNTDGTIEIWSIDLNLFSKGEIGDSLISQSKLINTLPGHRFSVKNVYCSFDGTKIISSSYYCTFCVWDISTGNKLMETNDDEQIIQICITSDDRNIISIGEKSTKVKIWDIATGHLINTLRCDTIYKPSAMTLIQRDNKFTLSLKKFL